MRFVRLMGLLLMLAACGTQNPTPAPVAVVEPTATLEQPATPAPSPTFLPTQTVEARITTAPVEVDTPSLSDLNAPPTPAAVTPTFNQAANQPVRLVIEDVGIDTEPVSVGLDEQNIPVVPKHDVGWYNLSAEPSEGENIVFWGHVLRWKDSPKIPAPFARVKDAKIGASLVIYTADGNEHRYTITEQVWVTPDQVQYILPLGEERVTLVSCIGDKVIRDGALEMTHRLITIAKPAK